LSDTRLKQFRLAMTEAKLGPKRTVVFSSEFDPTRSIPFKITYLLVGENDIFFFFGDQAAKLSKSVEWEKEARINELACLYSVAEWIEVSATIKDFFIHLPEYLAPGMQYPEQARIYSVYKGQEYGEKITSDKLIKKDLRVRGKVQGAIYISCLDDNYDFLIEEQKMLNEIGRMLNLALDRKELSESLAFKEEEEAELAGRVADLEKEIEARIKELDKQQKNLESVNAYFNQMSHGLLEAQERMQTIFKAIPDRMAIIDSEHNVIMTNRENVDAGDKCYKTFFDLDKPCRDCGLADVIKEKAPMRTEIKHEDDTFEVQALPVFDENEEVEFITEFYRNITKEKNYEQQLQQADKLASIGQLVSGIGHEINNPNQFIRGNIKIIQQAFDDMLPIIDEYHATHPDLKIARLKYDFFRQHIMILVNDMAHGSARIKGIVEGLKSFARKDEGELIDKVEINTIIDAAARLVHNEVHKTSDIKLNLTPGLPTFTGNVQKIEQVMINLVINASQAMPKDRRGKITVTTALEDSNIIITVNDNGKGMGERTLKQIFDPFFTTRRARGGTGLGLPIVHRIIEEHNGMISVNSKLDGGTTFLITMPIKEQSTSEADDTEESQ